jgi:hypothetical protein
MQQDEYFVELEAFKRLMGERLRKTAKYLDWEVHRHEWHIKWLVEKQTNLLGRIARLAYGLEPESRWEME